MTSDKRGWFPSSLSWLNAALLYGLLQLWGLASAAVIPALLELFQRSPRLAMVGFLVLVVSPAVAVTLLHHFGHGALDKVDRSTKKERDLFPGVASWWAGVLGWFILYATTTVTMFVLLVLFPPEPEQASFLAAAWKYSGGGAIASLHSILWVVIAAQLYDLERRARADA
jgi:hypothetical protein